MSYLTLLNLEQPPKVTADCELNAPTGLSMRDIASVEQFLIGLKTHTGQIVTPEKARRCSAVLACMRIISEDLSSLPLVLYKRTPQGDERATDHEIYTILDSAPNEIMTPLEVREHMVFDMMLYGNFYNLKFDDPSNPGNVGSIWPLQAGYVVRRWRELVWTYTDPLTGISGQFTDQDVWRGSFLAANAMDGTAITLLAREAIGLLLAAEEQGARLFSHGVQSDLVIEAGEDTTLDDDAKKQLREAFMARHSGSGNAFMPLIGEGGVTFKRIGLTAQESQYIESRKYQVEDIARVFRVPEVLLGNSTSGKSSTYASAEQFFQSYTKHTLGPWATRIEQTGQRDLLATREKAKYFLKHDFSSLLRADTAARYASYATGISSGFLSPADARRGENLPYVPGLDYYTRPRNTVATAGQDASEVKPTDQSGLADRVATFLFRKEQKALIGRKENPDTFYTHFGGFVEDMTGADLDSVLAYVEMRRATVDRFSAESQEKAINALIGLCKRDN